MSRVSSRWCHGVHVEWWMMIWILNNMMSRVSSRWCHGVHIDWLIDWLIDYLSLNLKFYDHSHTRLVLWLLFSIFHFSFFLFHFNICRTLVLDTATTCRNCRTFSSSSNANFKRDLSPRMQFAISLSFDIPACLTFLIISFKNNCLGWLQHSQLIIRCSRDSSTPSHLHHPQHAPIFHLFAQHSLRQE